MKSHTTPEELLCAIHDRPAMYLPNAAAKHPLTELAAFLTGYRMGCFTDPHSPVRPEGLIPHDFHWFVAWYFGLESAGGDAWFTTIENNVESEEEGFEMFFKLRREYDDYKEEHGGMPWQQKKE